MFAHFCGITGLDIFMCILARPLTLNVMMSVRFVGSLTLTLLVCIFVRPLTLTLMRFEGVLLMLSIRAL